MAKLTTDWSIEVSHLDGSDEFAVRLLHSSEKDCRTRYFRAAANPEVYALKDTDLNCYCGECSVSPLKSTKNCFCGEPLPTRQLIESAVRAYAERLAERIERDRGMP